MVAMKKEYHPLTTHTYTHRLRFAPIHGFQWIGDYLSVYYFPFNNAPGTCMQVCVPKHNSQSKK